MPGQVDCRYKSLEKLSEGGMGVVKAPEVKGGTVAGQGRAQPVSVRPSARLPQGMRISIDFDLYELFQSCK